MNRRLIFALVMVIALQNSRAADADAILDSWFAAQNNLRTWSADFVQTRTLKVLKQPLTTRGRVVFAAPDDFRWEFGRPARTIALWRDDEMLLVYPWLKRAERYPMGAGAPREWRDTASLLRAGFPRDRREFESQFRILSVIETNGAWQLSLQPKSPFARRLMPELRVGLATNDFSPADTEFIFVDGSTLRNDFTNAVLNPAPGRKLLDWTPPEDFKFIEPMGRQGGPL